MNIKSFETSISRKILDRGYGYYIEGNVLEATSPAPDEYEFFIQGSDTYKVMVQLDDIGEILYSECDCPYDLGPVCKHEVAAYYELNELLLDENKTKVEKPLSLHNMLVSLSKEELIQIILEITENDFVTKNQIMFKYSKGHADQELENCKRLIQSMVHKYMSKGFIHYRQASDFSRELSEVLEKVADTNDMLLAMDIAILVLTEAIGAFQYADDSSGDIGSVVNEAIQLISEIVSENDSIDQQLREKAFTKLMELVDHEVFDGWEEFQTDILWICTKYADEPILREKLKTKIQTLLSAKSDHYSRYNNESLLNILFDLIENFGTEEEAEQFIIDHLSYTTFREHYINKCIKEQNFEKVIELATEGERQDRQYAGLVTKWKEIRYAAYKELSYKEEQFALAMELFLDGKFEYYQEMKELTTDDQVVFYNHIKKELKKRKDWFAQSLYLQLIEEENDVVEIMEFVQKHQNYVEQYAELLIGHDKKKVIKIYRNYIKEEAKASSNRKAYQRICGKIKRFKKFAGVDIQQELISELKELYKRRPAFVDELNKLK